MRNFDAIVESMWDEDYSIWREVDSKSVLDSDGFYTDYTWYSDGDSNHIFIFGDKDIYEPDPSWADREISGDYSEAEEWFANYQGFADDLEESLKESYNVGDIFSDPHTYELYKNGQGAKWKISNIDDQGIHMTPVNKAAENVLQDVGPMEPLSAKELDEIINKGNLIKESINRRVYTESSKKELANQLYYKKAGTVVTLDGIKLTKLDDTPGGIWENPDMGKLYSDDWVEVLNRSAKNLEEEFTVGTDLVVYNDLGDEVNRVEFDITDLDNDSLKQALMNIANTGLVEGDVIRIEAVEKGN